MKRRAPFAIGAALLLLGAGCGGTSSSSAAEDVNSNDVYVMLAEQNRSGESGTARLIPLGKQTKVVLELTDPTATLQRAHIHAGSCDQLHPKPAYALSEVKSGMSTTTVDAKLTALRRGSFAIDVHDFACGEIGTGRTMD